MLYPPRSKSPMSAELWALQLSAEALRDSGSRSEAQQCVSNNHNNSNPGGFSTSQRLEQRGR